MSMLQVEELVSYQLRTAYLNEIADGVGERLITLNEGFLGSAPFKAAGWRPNPAHIKRTHSPPIPTAVASEYFQAPRAAVTLEDDQDDIVQVTGSLVAPKRRRRREQMEEDDSSDLSDESDDEPDQRAAQQIKFAKMPLRHRSGSSPIQSSNLRQTSTLASPQRAAPRRGSQSALETVKERARRDTVTSSEVSSDTEFEPSLLPQPLKLPTTSAPAPARTVRLQPPRMDSDPAAVGIKRQQSEPLEEEQEDSDGSDMSSVFGGSVDSASLLDPVDNPANVPPTSQIVGTPPREFTRSSTIRKSQAPPMKLHSKLPPPRPMSTVRPISMIQPTSLISAALRAKKTKPAVPFETFASFSGQGDPNPIMLRIYPHFAGASPKPFEIAIRRTVNEGQGADRPVAVADLIGLSLWRYTEEKREPPLPADKLNVNWWSMRMAEEGGEVDDDFPPLERKKPLTSFTTANNKAARSRANSKVFDDFALVQASASEFAENQKLTPQFTEEAAAAANEDELTPRNTAQPGLSTLMAGAPQQASVSASVPLAQGQAPPVTRETTVNPIITTQFRPNVPLADSPAAPISLANTTRGRKKLLRIHIMSSDLAPGQMITLDVTTSTYMEEVLDLVCKKRQLDKAAHVLRMPGSGGLVVIDRRVSSLGNVSDLELHRRRFATEGSSFAMTGSPSSSSPKPMFYAADSSRVGGLSVGGRVSGIKKVASAATPAEVGNQYYQHQHHQQHPLAQQTSTQDDDGDQRSKKYIVYRRQTIRGVLGGMERILSIEGEYVHIVPSSGGKATMEPGGKTVTVHFSNVIGCKVSRRHPTYIKFNVFTNAEKRYEFEAKSATEAAEIVYELKNRIAPYRDV